MGGVVCWIMCNYFDGSLFVVLLGDILTTLLLPGSRRRKSKLGCLLCALSSSLSSLALADRPQLQRSGHTHLQLIGRAATSMIQTVTHESGLQAIEIRVGDL